ncbi:hypothetical protein HID58_055791, partial [Brassica napus]
FNDLLENVYLPLQFLKPAFPTSVTQPSSLSVLVVVKDSEFMRITVLFLDEKMWLGKSNMSKALTLAKKQLESLSVSSLIHKKQSTHNSLYIIIY